VDSSTIVCPAGVSICWNAFGIHPYSSQDRRFRVREVITIDLLTPEQFDANTDDLGERSDKPRRNRYRTSFRPSLKHEDLEPVIGQLESQLRVLMLERAAILKRIGVIKKTVVGLVDLFGPKVINGELQDFLSLQSAPRSRTHPALTDLCRQLLREASEPLTVRQILGQLQEKSPAA
jgi:hypothetical protein